MTGHEFPKGVNLGTLIVLFLVTLSITGIANDTDTKAASLEIAAIQTGGDQVIVIANQSPDEITMAGYKLIAKGTDYQFEFQEKGSPTTVKPFGVLRIHSGSEAKPSYEDQVDIFWTAKPVWEESKIAKLISPKGEVVSIYDHSNKSHLDEFAGCLTKLGVKLKTLPYCGACQEQKELFGEATEYLVIVNCGEYGDFCGKRHKYVPAWMTEDKVLEGIKSLEELAQAFNCDYQGA